MSKKKDKEQRKTTNAEIKRTDKQKYRITKRKQPKEEQKLRPDKVMPYYLDMSSLISGALLYYMSMFVYCEYELVVLL